MKCNSQRGWTLIEAMISVSVVTILSSVALPSMRDLLDAACREALASEALSALRTARSEAIKRNDQVVLCKAATPQECTASGGWEQGWLAFHDANGNARLDPGEDVVLQRHALPPGWRLSGNTPLAQRVAYQSFGETRLPTGAFQAGTFTLCKTSAEATTAVRIVINSMGRPRVETVKVASC